jgi:cell division protein FtsZ
LGPKATRGLGAGGLPEIGEAAAEESYRDLAAVMDGAEMVFLTAGMGGGTGTGAIPIAAKVAKAVGAVTIAIVTKPFSFELGKRQKNCELGLQKLREFADTLIAIPNDKLIQVAPRDLPLEMAFTLADDVLRQGVQGISELITETGLINVDFSHIKSVMQRGGGSLMAIGTGSGPDRVKQAIEKALHHPLLDEIDLYSATNMIANFTGSANLSFRDVTDALQILQEASGYHADIIPGVITDPRMEDRVQLILIVTGIGNKPGEMRENKSHDVPFEQKTVSENPVEWNTEKNKSDKSTKFQGFNEISQEDYLTKVEPENNLDVPAFLRRRSYQSR